MEKHEQLNKTVGIALLFTTITSIFSLLNRLAALIVTSRDSVGNYFKSNILWFAVVAAIISILAAYYKKSNEKGFLYILQNEDIRITTGVLISIQGLISLAGTLPAHINTLQFLLKTMNIPMNVTNGRTITTMVVSVILIICQVLLGVYLARFFKSKVNATSGLNNED